MSSTSRSFVFRAAVVAWSCGLLGACALLDRPVPFKTVDGPETPDILVGLAGHFTVDEGFTSICYPLRTIDPALQQRCIPHLNDETGWGAAIVPERSTFVLRMRMTYQAGPAAEVVRLPVDVKLEALTYCPHGEPRCAGETIATWTRPPGSNLYNQTLSISPDGRRVAIVPESHLVQGPGYHSRYPRRDLRFNGQRLVGPLKIVDLQTKAIRDTGIEVADRQPISWSRDGRRLLLVRAEPVDRLPARLAAQVVGDEGQDGQGVPVIEVLDLETHALTMLAIGQQPVWSPDNRTLLYQPADDRVELLDLSDFSRHPALLPGMSTRYEPIAIAFVSPRRVLYWGVPTAGTAPAFTSYNSPLVGPKQMVSLKVADLDTGAFATVYPLIDPRSRVGYRAE